MDQGHRLDERNVNGCHELGVSRLTFDTGPLGQVIDNDLTRVDMIIDKWHPSLWAIPTEDGDSGQAEPCGSYNFLCAI